MTDTPFHAQRRKLRELAGKQAEAESKQDTVVVAKKTKKKKKS